jgi:hypothetical protein
VRVYGQICCGVTLSALQQECHSEHLQITEFASLDDEEEDDDTPDVEEEVEDGDSNCQTILAAAAALQPLSPPTNLAQHLSFCHHLSPDTPISSFITPLQNIITTRTSSSPTDSSYFPLTSRSVERIFSAWRRVMDLNVLTKPSTVQMSLLLRLFSHTEIEYILRVTSDSEFTKWYADHMLKRDNRRDRNATIYARTLKNTTENRRKMLVHKNLSLIREQYHITPPATNGRFWKKQHTLEFFEQAGIVLSIVQKKWTADRLQNFAIESFQSLHPNSLCNTTALLPIESAVQHDDVLASPTVVQVQKEVTKTNVVHGVESILSHTKVKGKYAYLTKWTDGTETLVQERDFKYGFCLTEYWVGLSDEKGKVKKGGDKREIEGMEEEKEGEEAEEAEELAWKVSKIVDHIEIQNVMFYKVKWVNESVLTWEPYTNFDNDEDFILARYWKQLYNSKK